MSYINSYQPPQLYLSEDNIFGPDPYDLNFPYSPGTLSTDRVQLTPFIPRLHAQAYLDAIKGHNGIFRYMPVSFATQGELLGFTEVFMRRDAENLLFVIIDTTRPDPARPELRGSVAGIVGLMHTSSMFLKTEIAPVVVLPQFQRTHVASHAIGLLLRYALEIPANGGMGMRRVAWTAHPDNAASVKLAIRMGLKFEGRLRWYDALVSGNLEGMALREGDPSPEQPGRDIVLYAICWDDWVKEGRELGDRAIARV